MKFKTKQEEIITFVVKNWNREFEYWEDDQIVDYLLEKLEEFKHK